MQGLKEFFLRTRNIQKSSYAWNTASGLMFAMQSAVLLIVISRTNDLEDAGVFSIAYAIASLMSLIGEYGVRKYQISDIQEDISFIDYHTHRVLTCIIMLVCSLVYSGIGFLRGQYKIEKFFVIIIVCLLKLVEAYADVFYSRYQQKRRLDVAGKTNTFRIIVSMGCCIISLIITHNLLISVIVWFVTALITLFFSSLLVANNFGGIHFHIRREPLRKITKECFPLFVGTFLLLYVGNEPKYAIDACMNDQAQACYNFIFMPVFVIGLLANFIFNPILVQLANEWKMGEKRKFLRMTTKQVMVIFGITCLAVVVALTFGCPVLGWLYNTNLLEYRNSLVILMVGGGMLAYANFFSVVVTVIRYQHYLTVGYVMVAILARVFSHTFVEQGGIMGAAFFYTILMSALTVIFVVVLIICLKKEAKK